MSFKSILVFSISLFMMASCNSVSSEEQAIREAAKANLTANNTTKPTTPPAVNERINKNSDNKNAVSGPTTKMEFKELTYDFGNINEGAQVKHTFEFTNMGTEPLVIQGAKASCGCTVPKYSDVPVAPGESGEIEVIFDSKGRPGKTSKYVTVTANTEPVKTKIFLTGEVNPKKK